jgi:cytochrome c biogenesis protein CcmG/thiol:disulfide interchange protein DsbE
MTAKQTLRHIIPFITFFTLLGLLGWELFYSKPHDLPSALVGEDLPAFNLPNLFPQQPAFTNQALRGNTILINVWASWCDACAIEHAMLMKISTQYHVPIYSINYKDTPKDAMRWLKENGNPYALTGQDINGDTAIDFGVYGTPETFVVNAQRKIIYRHIGAINQQAWDEILYPLIQKNNG